MEIGTIITIICIVASVLALIVGYHINNVFSDRYRYNLWGGSVVLLVSAILFWLAFEKGSQNKWFVLYIGLATAILLCVFVFNVYKTGANVLPAAGATLLQFCMSAGILFILLVIVLFLNGSTKKKGNKRRK